LCYSLDIPLLEVSTLHALAAQVIAATPHPERYLFCPMLDARRMEVYTCLLDSQLQEASPIEPVVLDKHTFENKLLTQQVIFFGSGARKFKELVQEKEHALFVEDVLPSAKTIGQLALAKYAQKAFEDVAYYEPFYLKDVYITSAGKSAK
jgi:tRNA threonylcarbamoyladenosine biosynthesis protein TsaB